MSCCFHSPRLERGGAGVENSKSLTYLLVMLIGSRDIFFTGLLTIDHDWLSEIGPFS